MTRVVKTTAAVERDSFAAWDDVSARSKLPIGARSFATERMTSLSKRVDDPNEPFAFGSTRVETTIAWRKTLPARVTRVSTRVDDGLDSNDEGLDSNDEGVDSNDKGLESNDEVSTRVTSIVARRQRVFRAITKR